MNIKINTKMIIRIMILVFLFLAEAISDQLYVLLALLFFLGFSFFLERMICENTNVFVDYLFGGEYFANKLYIFIISMLFRILVHPEVLEMLATVVRQARAESEERWRRVSRQMIDHVLPRVRELVIESRETLDVLHALFDSLHTSVFR